MLSNDKRKIILNLSIMSVVNCKVKHIRPEYTDLQDWMNDENNIYIGRRGVVFINKNRFPEKSSNFANPYKIGKDGTREEVLEKYKEYIIDKINNDHELMRELNSMKGKTLGCWCFPERCHGNILLELIESHIC